MNEWTPTGVQRLRLDVLLRRGEPRHPAESELYDDGLPAVHLRRHPLPAGGRPPSEDQIPRRSNRGLFLLFFFFCLFIVQCFHCFTNHSLTSFEPCHWCHADDINSWAPVMNDIFGYFYQEPVHTDVNALLNQNQSHSNRLEQANTKLNQNQGILSSMMEDLKACVRVTNARNNIVADIIPFIVPILTPNLRPVSSPFFVCFLFVLLRRIRCPEES